MSTDDDADDVGGYGQPLPPDDRLWRHPSEVFASGEDPPVLDAPAPLGPARAPARPWAVALVAGVAGAVLATGVLALTDGPWRREVPRDVVERVALSPVISAPTVRGDRQASDAASRVSPSLVRIEVGDGERVGSGVALRDDGHLVTAAALVAGARKLSVVIGDRRLHGRLVGADPVTGVAVVKVEAGSVPAAVFAGGDTHPAPGDPAVAVAAARSGSARPVVAAGAVRALGQSVEHPDRVALHGLAELDVSLGEAALGGPVVDSRGAVIGLAELSPDPSARRSYAIPIGLAKRVAGELIDTGTVRHCWLGVEGGDLGAGDATLLGLAGGASVHRVISGSPAEAAGIEAGDVITGFAGAPVASMSDLVVAMREHAPGDVVTVELRRAGTVQVVETELGTRP